MNKARDLAIDLMNQNGLDDVKFKFNRRKNALGICRYRNGKAVSIELSSYWTEHLEEEHVKDTILHEIAHALTPGDHHGSKWKAVAQKIGANPTRTAEEVPKEIQKKVAKIHAKYRAECTSCDNIVYFNRMGKTWQRGGYVCGACRSPLEVHSN